MSRAALGFVLGLGVVAVGCYESPQRAVELALEVAGTPAPDVPLVGGGSVELTRAELAFGPLWLCPGAQAGELCDTARLEWLGTARVDVLSERARRVGELVGQSGGVRSYMYDLGIVSLLGEPGSRFVAPEVEALGGSVWLEGVAHLPDVDVPFEVRLELATAEGSEQGVPVVRKSSSEAFGHEVSEGDEALRVTFAPGAWFGELRASDFSSDAPCAPGLTLGCDSGHELRCEDGREVARRDCSASGRACHPEAGCVERLTWSDDSTVHRALVQALTAGARPRFDFR